MITEAIFVWIFCACSFVDADFLKASERLVHLIDVAIYLAPNSIQKGQRNSSPKNMLCWTNSESSRRLSGIMNHEYTRKIHFQTLCAIITSWVLYNTMTQVQQFSSAQKNAQWDCVFSRGFTQAIADVDPSVRNFVSHLEGHVTPTSQLTPRCYPAIQTWNLVKIPGLIPGRVCEETKTTQENKHVQTFVLAWLWFRVSFGGSKLGEWKRERGCYGAHCLRIVSAQPGSSYSLISLLWTILSVLIWVGRWACSNCFWNSAEWFIVVWEGAADDTKGTGIVWISSFR